MDLDSFVDEDGLMQELLEEEGEAEREVELFDWENFEPLAGAPARADGGDEQTELPFGAASDESDNERVPGGREG
eukprot:328300-Rhodomonas_salina.1